ncbi:MAG: alpha/beta hydrolase [Taibaiella sp.]|nr:alpha/beta hydrolase [Taibaiella sp.]
MVRLVISILLLLWSLLCVFPAPVFFMWYMAIMVTEFPVIFISATVLVLLWGIKVNHWQLAGTLTGAVALLLFLTPVVRSYLLSRTLKKNLEQAFNGMYVTKQNKPFKIGKLFSTGDKVYAPFTTVVYNAPAAEPLTMDVYQAGAKGNRPCIIVVHGGSWAGGDSRQLPELNERLTTEGYVIVSINYRLAPEFHSPAPVEDLVTAMKYLKANASQYHIDTTRFVLLGRSAGAQIAMAAAYNELKYDVAGVISFYGPSDMIWGYLHPNSPLVMNSCKVMDDYLGGTLAQLPERYKASSPAEYVTGKMVPTLLLHGTNDALVAYEHSPRLVAKLKNTPTQYYLLTMPWATHGCDYTLNGPSGQLTTYAVEAFLKHVCR